VVHDCRLQLARVGEVGHDRQVPAGGHDPFEQPQQVVGVAVGEVPLRPERQRLRADAERGDVLQVRVVQ